MRMRLTVCLVAIALLAQTLGVQAVGTVTQTYYSAGNVRKVAFAVTADAAAGTVPNTVLTTAIEGRLLAIETNPGSTAPTDNYDITLEDGEGFDVLQGVGANRDTANTERAAIVIASTSLHPVVDETDVLTLKIANNSVNSATITVVIYYALGG
jgi:predicted RNA methylase